MKSVSAYIDAGFKFTFTWAFGSSFCGGETQEKSSTITMKKGKKEFAAFAKVIFILISDGQK